MPIGESDRKRLATRCVTGGRTPAVGLRGQANFQQTNSTDAEPA